MAIRYARSRLSSAESHAAPKSDLEAGSHDGCLQCAPVDDHEGS